METASGTLLYDGECGFCSTCVRWLIARQSDRSTLCFVSSSDVTNEGLGELSLTRRDVDRYLWWIGPTAMIEVRRRLLVRFSALGEFGGGGGLSC